LLTLDLDDELMDGLFTGRYKDAIGRVKLLWQYIGASVYPAVFAMFGSTKKKIATSTDSSALIKSLLDVSDEAIIWVMHQAKIDEWRPDDDASPKKRKRGRKKRW
jgi:hypothetical protein